MTDSKPDVLTPNERRVVSLVIDDMEASISAKTLARALLRLAPEPVKPVVRIGELPESWRAGNGARFVLRDCDCAFDLEAAIASVDVESVAKAIQREQYTGEGHPAYPWEKCDQDFWRRRARFAISAILGVKP